MIQQSDMDSQTSIEAELDQLTYSAYLLTLDLAKALSEFTPRSDLQRRTSNFRCANSSPVSHKTWLSPVWPCRGVDLKQSDWPGPSSCRKAINGSALDSC